ncbi:hypothetical protein Vadar_002336 [Vaccinium darrowii]|uniref:Uncharacterized protein n=1 Tax=Vaccinium darrowii TaxID=229202 RepID=A0ACB7Y608_9ERIC|nr:hypothetical protein Vadar_002336 [Vaccinium darrowii]
MAPVRWSELPLDLLTSIGTRLDNRIDVLRFRSVCSSWRNSIPPFRKWPHRRFTLPNRRGSLRLTRTTVLRLQPIHTPPDSPPPKPWLIRVSESSKTRLLNPLFDMEIKPLTPLLVNLSQFRISEIGRSYQVKYVDLADFGFFTNAEEDWPIRFDKVVFLSDIDRTGGGRNTDDAVVVALQSHHHIFGGHLAAIKLGEDEFMPIAYSTVNEFHDIIHFNDLIYAVDVYGNCYTVDSLLNISLIVPHTNGQLAGKKNLVESARELIMVERFSTKHDIEEFNCRGNCIFFVDEYCMLFDNNYHDQYDELRILGEMEIGVFNLEDSSVGPLVLEDEVEHLEDEVVEHLEDEAEHLGDEAEHLGDEDESLGDEEESSGDDEESSRDEDESSGDEDESSGEDNCPKIISTYTV